MHFAYEAEQLKEHFHPEVIGQLYSKGTSRAIRTVEAAFENSIVLVMVLSTPGL